MRFRLRIVTNSQRICVAPPGRTIRNGRPKSIVVWMLVFKVKVTGLMNLGPTLTIDLMIRSIKKLRMLTKPLAFRVLRLGFFASLLSFCFGLFLTDEGRAWALRFGTVFFALSLVGFVIHFSFIALDETQNKNFGTAIWMVAWVLGFAWIIQSCIRGTVLLLK